MPAADQRRSSSNRSQRRPHSRTSSHTSVRQATVGGLTTIDQSASRENVRREPSERQDGGPSNARKKGVEASQPPRPALTTARTSSKEAVPTLKKPTAAGRHVAIVSPAVTATKDDEDDSDAWVSSESGAATPNHEPTSPRRGMVVQAGETLSPTESRTPPATRQPLPPAEPFIRTPSPTDTARLHAPQVMDRVSVRSSPGPDRAPESVAPRASSQHGHHHHGHHHQALHLQRPHPLIRATSHSSALASPSYLTATPSVSTPISESPPPNSPPMSTLMGSALNERRSSISSSRSVSTLPLPNTATVSTFAASGKGGMSPLEYGRPRERTMSAMSHSSAALSSLAAIPRIYNARQSTGPANPPIVSRFAPSEAEEDRHPLLRQPYLMDHLSILQYYDPLHASAKRVAKAKGRIERT
ncbi:hypothetical protein M407DRAFT_12309 [Tulasnella calospora MUT 4182]|uniref:Uncharacterized protein n=1 Tax=Tulasnella calospora MUT 4182 TaxID=1051891 RepID=A0A0C3PS67_9AGAM|nr:hypothetical protein M407DRAFT_12309 [Tulasnella calospora MUT 4182]